MRRIILLLTLYLLLSLSVSAEAKDGFISNGRSIKVEWFFAGKNPSTNKLPTVIILHGSSGLDSEGGFFRDIAKDLSAHGRHACVVHYMDQSGLKQANNFAMAQHFGNWVGTVQNAFS